MNRRNGNIKEVGHTFLARFGKTRLRPRGKQATDRLLAQGNITQQTKTLEVACNRGTTMLELAQKYDCQVIGIDLDAKVVAKAKENIKRYGLEERLSVQQGERF